MARCRRRSPGPRCRTRAPGELTTVRPTLESRLEPEVRALADWREGEAAWRRADLPRLARAARAAGLACTGGQAQIRLPDGLHELYWQDYDPGPQRVYEDWPAYVVRSWKEALFLVDGLPPDEVILGGARRLLPELEGLSDAEAAEGLWFVVYLEAEG